MRMIAAFAALFLLAQPADAEVVETDATSFTVRHTAELTIPGAGVWNAFAHVGEWWPSDHTWSGAASNLTLEPRANGCFCEIWDGASVAHGRVVRAQPNAMLRLRAELGPIQEMAAFGILTFTLEEADGRTTLTGTYRVAGAQSAGLEALAPIVDRVFGQQFARLARYAETGAPE